MIRILDTTHKNLIALEVMGKLTEADYQTINPVIDEAVNQHGKINLYVEIKDLEGFTPKAAWEDIKEIRRLDDLEKVAIIGERDWKTKLTEMTNLATPAAVRYFGMDDKKAALQWVDGQKEAT